MKIKSNVKKDYKKDIKDNTFYQSTPISANGAVTKVGWVCGHVASGQSSLKGECPVKDMDTMFGP